MHFSLALIGTLLGEMFGSQRGVGHLLMQAMRPCFHSIAGCMRAPERAAR